MNQLATKKDSLVNSPRASSEATTVLTPQRASTAWEQVESVLLKHHHKPDLQAARGVYAGVAAHRLSGAPVWPMLVGAPGSMKTELLSGLEGQASVRFLDQLTPQTFISGHIQDDNDESEPSGLLQRIGKQGIIVYPDFSTILGMKREAKASILADMRRIYDGELSKEFGTPNKLRNRAWTGRITFLVAATPDVDQHYGVFQTLGERFVMIRWPRAGGIEVALTAMNQRTGDARRELKGAVDALLRSLGKNEPILPEQYQHRIAALTEFTTRCRTHVPRDGWSKVIVYVPEAESATRLAQQFAQLAKGSAMLDGRGAVEEADYQLVQRVAFDCIPAARRAILDALIGGQPLNTVHLPASTRSYVVEELETQDVLKDDSLSTLSSDLLALAGVLKR